MTDKQHINDKHSDKFVDCFEQLDNMSVEDIEALLSDEEAAGDAMLVMDYHNMMQRKHADAPDAESAWKEFIQEQAADEEPASGKTAHRRLFAYAAAIAAAVIVAVFVVVPQLLHTGKQLVFEANDEPREILMGDDGGSLSVVQGRQEAEGTLVSDTKADFSHAKNTANKTIATPRGKDYTVVLSDGTVVLLNAESKLTFPTRFTQKNRVVKLEGEAYFKVSKNKHHPFIVETEKLQTRVLGTEFNLKAYPNTAATVTLIEGSVAVNSQGQEVRLKPGQNAELSSEQTLTVTDVDTEYFTQWKDGYFYFDNVPLLEIVRELGRWYNINVEIADDSLAAYKLHFIASRKASVGEFVENLNEFSYLSVTLKGSTLVIDKRK